MYAFIALVWCIVKLVIVTNMLLFVANVTHKHLYPALTAAVESVKEDGIQPFTDEQLRSLYYNYELEHIDEFVEEFLQVGVFSAIVSVIVRFVSNLCHVAVNTVLCCHMQCDITSATCTHNILFILQLAHLSMLNCTLGQIPIEEHLAVAAALFRG